MCMLDNIFVYMRIFFNSEAYLPNWPKSKAIYIKTAIHDIFEPFLNNKLYTLRFKNENINLNTPQKDDVYFIQW
jgi:hypothetical protein